MPPSYRWRVQGVDRKTRRLARQAAARNGMTVGEWIDKAIINHGGVTPRGPTAPLVPAEFVRSARISEAPSAEPTPGDVQAAIEAEIAAEPEPEITSETESAVTSENSPDIDTGTAPDPLPVIEPESETEPEPEPESEPADYPATPLTVDPSDRPAPSVPVEPAVAAAATPASRRMDPRIMGGVLIVALMIGGYWLLGDSAPEQASSPTGTVDITGTKPPKPTVEKLSLTEDLESAAPRRPETPFERMTAAAASGDPKAQHDLAIMYLRGNGVPIDHAQAATWLEKSAGAGIPKAQYNLGLLYEKGLGVTQNYGTAFLWYQRAARQGHTRAQHNLGTLFAVGKGTKQDYAEAARWFTRASKEGLAEAHYSLGLLHEKGLGVKSDPRKAAAFYRSALAAGSAQAAEKLTRLEPALKELPPRLETTLTDRATPVKKKPLTDPPKNKTLSPAGIVNLQRLLAKLDLSPGPADGVIGKRTIEAIKLYQRFAGLPVDGKPTPDLLKDLRQVVGAMSPGGAN